MCGERDETTGGDDVVVATQAEAEQAMTGGQRPVYYDSRYDCLWPWFDAPWAVALDDPAEPSEASCADWSAGFIGLKPRAPKAPPSPLSIPFRALSHPQGSAPLIEHLVSAPWPGSGA